MDTHVVFIEFDPSSPPNDDEFSPFFLSNICDLRELGLVHVFCKTVLLGMEDTDQHPVPHDDVRVLGGELEVLLEDNGGSGAGAGFFGRVAGEDFVGRCRRGLLYGGWAWARANGRSTVQRVGPAFAFTVFAEGGTKAGETRALLLLRRKRTCVEVVPFRARFATRGAAGFDYRWDEVGLRVTSRGGRRGWCKVGVLWRVATCGR